MSNLSEYEKEGIIDFLRCQSTTELVLSLASVISNNAFKCSNESDAIDVILLHSLSVYSILNRKLITKTMLFKYLHDKRVPVTESITKQSLIDKIINYWNKSTSKATAHPVETNAPHQSTLAAATSGKVEHEFPIHQMSRAFARWFYDNLNASKIAANDFWSDVRCETNFLENRTVMQHEQLNGSEYTEQHLKSLITNYQLYFNLNDCFDGVQGRIDPHGLVLVLSCGTLHKTDQFVGTFESVFGLLRDPFADNNWKIKHINLRLHNSLTKSSITPVLQECESMGELLCLEAPCQIEEVE